MLGRTKESQMDKATTMMRDVVKYAHDVAQISDYALTFAPRSITDPRRTTGSRKTSGQAASTHDWLLTRLRKNLRAMLDDLDHAGGRGASGPAESSHPKRRDGARGRGGRGACVSARSSVARGASIGHPRDRVQSLIP